MSGARDLGRQLGRAVADPGVRARVYRAARIARTVDAILLILFLILFFFTGVRNVFGLGIGWYVTWFAVLTPLDWVACRKLDPRRRRVGRRAAR